MHGQELWAVVPVKRFGDTKQRLAPLLGPNERAALASAMLDDVLSALMRARSLAGVLVVTGDADAAALARSAGAQTLADREDAGTSAAVACAARYIAGAGQAGMLVIPADLPSIMPADIETIVEAHRATPSVTLVPATVDGGTNALASSPPDIVPFSFGDDSFRRHVEAARARGIEPAILRIDRFGHDIDRPEDLADFARRPSTTRTFAYLTASGIAQRLGQLPASMPMTSRRATASKNGTPIS